MYVAAICLYAAFLCIAKWADCRFQPESYKKGKDHCRYLCTFLFGTGKIWYPKLMGRYYWMGLGAFASKTVAFSFSAWQSDFDTEATRILAAGNFWLFMDVSPWHWGYNQCEQSFNKCFEKRDYSNLAKIQSKVATAIQQFISFFGEPEALKEIGYFKTRKGGLI